MIEITQDQYDEYQQLKHHFNFQSNLKSIRDTKYLKDDIDRPIRLPVAMLALLGCEPLFSCCGFDYEGQPIHKAHEYGSSYVMISNTERGRYICGKLAESNKIIITDENNLKEKWNIYTLRDGRIIIKYPFIWSRSRTKYPWSLIGCIHFYESGIIGIEVLVSELNKLSDLFLDEVTLYDTNKEYKDRQSDWVYPPLEPWHITKINLLTCP